MKKHLPLIPHQHPIRKMIPEIGVLPRIYQAECLDIFNKSPVKSKRFAKPLIRQFGYMNGGKFRFNKEQLKKSKIVTHFRFREDVDRGCVGYYLAGLQHHRPKIYNENWCIGCAYFD